MNSRWRPFAVMALTACGLASQAQIYYTVDVQNSKLYSINPNTAVVTYLGNLNTTVTQADLAWHQGSLYMLDSGAPNAGGRVFQIVTTGAWRGWAIPGAILSGAGYITADQPGGLTSDGTNLIVAHGTTAGTLSWKLSSVNPVSGVLASIASLGHDCDALARDSQYWSMDVDNGSGFDWLVRGNPPSILVGQAPYSPTSGPADIEVVDTQTLVGPSKAGTTLVRISKTTAAKTVLTITGAQDANARFDGIAKGTLPPLWRGQVYYSIDTQGDALYQVGITSLNNMTASAAPIGPTGVNFTDPDLAWHVDALYAIDNTFGPRTYQIVTSGAFAGRAIGGAPILAPGPVDGLASTAWPGAGNLVFGYWEPNGSSQFWMANLNPQSGIATGSFYWDPDIDALCYGWSPQDNGMRLLQYDAGIQFGGDMFVARPLNFNGFTMFGFGSYNAGLSPNDIEELSTTQVVGINAVTRRLVLISKASNLAVTPFTTTGFPAASTPTGLAFAPSSKPPIGVIDDPKDVRNP